MPASSQPDGTLTMVALRRCASALALVTIGLSTHADAQPNAERRWEVEFHAGVADVTQSTDGSFVLPDPGRTITAIGGPPLIWRQVSSWYFGDGALLFRQANTGRPFSPVNIQPLDTMLTTASARRGTGGAFGVRLRRQVTSRVGLEMGLSLSGTGPAFTDEARATVEASRNSFEQAWLGALAGKDFPTFGVSSTATFDPGSAKQMRVTVAMDYVLIDRGTDRISLVGGAGSLTNTGSGPSVTLAGHYTGDAPGIVSYDESDLVTVRVESDRVTVVTFVGGGWTRWLTSRWGVRADVRLMFSENSVTMRLDATPGRVTTSDRSEQFGLIFGGGEPAVVLYNGSDVPQGTSLSGDHIRSFATFSGTGWDRHFVTTIGAVWRF